jgi:glyoxylase-like metal-dependent hydrolase (beta-lactamase superfamily II)
MENGKLKSLTSTRELMINRILLFFFCSLYCTLASFAQIFYTSEHVEMELVEDGLLWLRENYEFGCNSLIIEGDSGVLIVDTGFREIAGEFSQALKFLGKEVKVIVNSHGHHDHVGANDQFGDRVTFVGKRECKEDIVNTEASFLAVEDSLTLAFEGFRILCASYPGGHSACDMLVYIPELRAAFLGDFFFSESFPLVLVDNGSTVHQLVSNLKEIYTFLPPDTRVCPGHGKLATHRELGEYIRMLEQTSQVVWKEMKSGKSMEEIKSAAVLSTWDSWGSSIPFITTDSWIEQIWFSYQHE